MSAKHTTRTEMKGDTSRHGPRVDAKRVSNKARRRADLSAIISRILLEDRDLLEALRKGGD